LRLAFAAQRAGLVTSEVAATIRSGLDAGAKSPRELPDLSAPATTATPGLAIVAGPPAPGGPPECVKAIVERLSDVDPKEVEWLFPNRIPLGKITLIAGDQGLGKSFLTMDLIARVTTGGEVPCGDGECVADGSAVLLSAEDGLADTIRPRLDAAGADCRRVFALTTLELPDGRLTPFTLAYIPQLEATITGAPDCKLVVIDPVGAYVGGVDDHKGATLRAVLGPLSSLAERTNTAIVLVTHLNKGGGTRALQRVTGSLVYTALARAAWLIVRDKDDPGRRLMLSIKNNLAPDPSGLAYRITADRRVEWEGETIRMTANEALARDQEDEAPAPKRRRRAEDAADWLAAQFPDGMGVPSKEILARGKAAGFSRDALFEAKKELGIGARKQPGGDGGWAWFAAPADPSRGQESDGSPPFNACDS
jgi:putative DNA primase/helicase